jgi:hypothetical protein
LKAVFGIALCVVWSACAVPVRAIGVVATVKDLTEITSTEGNHKPLALKGREVAMRYLDGHEVDLVGTWTGGAIVVSRWHVTQGLHGLPAWVGEVRRTPDGLALFVWVDGVTLPIERENQDLLEPFLDRPVLVEGYLEASVGLRVVYFRPLFDEAELGAR